MHRLCGDVRLICRFQLVTSVLHLPQNPSRVVSVHLVKPAIMEPGTLERHRAALIDYRVSGQFLAGAEYVESLPRDVRAKRSVAVEICQLYLVQGQHRLAADACDAVGESIFLDPDKDYRPSDLLDEEVVAFELLRAFVWIGRYSKLSTALKIAQKVNIAWRLQSEDGLGDRGTSDGAQVRETGMSESRVSGSISNVGGFTTNPRTRSC